MKHILSVLALPPTARLTVQCRGFDSHTEELIQGFRALIPQDRSGLPLLSHLTHAEACLYDGSRKLVACSSTSCDDSYPSLTLDLKISDYNTVGIAEPPLSDDVLDILCTAPLEHLRIELPAHKIFRVDWTAMFLPFPQLRHLAIRGIGIHDDAVPIYKSLTPCLMPDPGTSPEQCLLLPKLRSLRIEGFDAGNYLPTALKWVLEDRKVCLGKTGALDELYFELDNHRSGEHFEDRRAAYVDFFESSVQKLVYVPGQSKW